MDLNLLLTSDVHSYIVPTNYDHQAFNAPFGLERAATVIKDEQAKSTHSLTFDDGDYLEGSPLSAYLAQTQDRPRQIDQAFNLIHYDYGIVGNHEFNYGQCYLKRSIRESKRCFLCANITNQNGKHPFGKPYDIRNVNGISVGVIGFTTQAIPQWEIPKHIQGLQFHSVVKTAKKYIPIMKNKADVIIAAYHGGLERDQYGHPTGTLNGENEGYQLLKQVKGIDALLTGHQHRVIAEHLFGVPVIQVGCKGQLVGKITLHLTNDHTGAHVTGSQIKLIPTKHYAIDRTMVKQIQPLEKQIDNQLDKSLATSRGPLSYQDPNQVRLHNCSYLDLIQRIQMRTAGTDLSTTSLFANDAHGFTSPITLRQVFANYIFPNKLALSIITGKDLKAALEQSAGYFTYRNHKLMANEAFRRKGRYYMMFTGINYIINVAKPLHHRVTNLTYHGQPIRPQQKLRIALNNYTAVGGGHCYMFNADQIQKISHQPLTTIIANYLKRHSVINATVHHNFKIIYQP